MSPMNRREALKAAGLIAGGVFLVNAASTKYRTASYAPPTLNSVPITPANPSAPAPKQ